MAQNLELTKLEMADLLDAIQDELDDPAFQRAAEENADVRASKIRLERIGNRLADLISK